MKDDNQSSEVRAFKERAAQRIFEGIEDEIAILTANAKFNYTTSKNDEHTLKITLAYIEDTTRLVILLKKRIKLLIENTA